MKDRDKLIVEVVMLVLADVSEAKELLALQHSAFAALYEIYHDQYNPAIESLEDFCSRFSRPNCRYYKIVKEKRTVGLIRTTVAENANEGWIGLIGLAPSVRKKGYASKAMLDLERLYPSVKRWVLCTVLQEKELVAFYEKLGYKPINVEPEQAGMDMAYMEKWL